ncbi:hypothetical protein [Novosphingobium sp. Rr 2-17]|uniref:hypothetical protein n=1 Tax=Novosphingobium sp. Rr 2-17 TaxID=555793 RepID=UPI0005B85811|nr:hypothetical protein [Novosphingobium sp. Rr 2-17]
MVDFPDVGLAAIFGGLVLLRRGVDLALQLLAGFLGGIVGAFLRGLFLGGADPGSVGEAADAGDAGGERAGKGELVEA